MSLIALLFAVATVVAFIGFPLLLILYAAGEWPRWRKRSVEERKRRRGQMRE